MGKTTKSHFPATIFHKTVVHYDKISWYNNVFFFRKVKNHQQPEYLPSIVWNGNNGVIG